MLFYLEEACNDVSLLLLCREQKYKSLSSIFSFIFLPLKVSLSKGFSVYLPM